MSTSLRQTTTKNETAIDRDGKIETRIESNRIESALRNRFDTHGKSNILCYFASNDHFIYCLVNVRHRERERERQHQTRFWSVRVGRICAIRFNKFSPNMCDRVRYRIFGVIKMFANDGKVR